MIYEIDRRTGPGSGTPSSLPSLPEGFFSRRLVLDSRELTPGLVEKIVFAGAESRSEKCAQIVLQKVGGCEVSIKVLEWVLHDGGSRTDRPAGVSPVQIVGSPSARRSAAPGCGDVG